MSGGWGRIVPLLSLHIKRYSVLARELCRIGPVFYTYTTSDALINIESSSNNGITARGDATLAAVRCLATCPQSGSLLLAQVSVLRVVRTLTISIVVPRILTPRTPNKLGFIRIAW